MISWLSQLAVSLFPVFVLSVKTSSCGFTVGDVLFLDWARLAIFQFPVFVLTQANHVLTSYLSYHTDMRSSELTLSKKVNACIFSKMSNCYFKLISYSSPNFLAWNCGMWTLNARLWSSPYNPRPLFYSTADAEWMFSRSVISSTCTMNEKRVITAWDNRFEQVTSHRQQGAVGHWVIYGTSVKKDTGSIGRASAERCIDRWIDRQYI